ncbi:MAG: phytoene desaturase [Flavobacteriales bacterium]|nr:phytoene desaturase [Flavobacteriales bacterium]
MGIERKSKAGPATVVVIGSGFAGLAAASCLAKEGYQVTVLEKNTTPGGRARKFDEQGFMFDMGPSWYWMPDVFEQYFAHFGHSISDLYDLKRLDPSYNIWFTGGEKRTIPADRNELSLLFEEIEPGSSTKLQQFLKEAAYKYDVGMKDLVFRPGRSLSELMDLRLIKGLFDLHMFRSMTSHIKDFFKDERLIQLLEFPVLFLGAKPAETPALYSLMNHADLSLGTWYPMGGMHRIIEAMVRVAEEQGVRILCNETVERIEVRNGSATNVKTSKGQFDADFVVGAADYHHVEQHLLEKTHRQYSERYWESRSMAPSSLIYYLGVNRRIEGLEHHNLFFDKDLRLHAHQIYTAPQWPTDPLFYLSAPSKTDPTVAPEGCENLFVLIPVAPGLEDSEQVRNEYYHRVMDRVESLLGQKIRPYVIYNRSYAHSDFRSDYNAFKGNAYGLANTLMQTANLKPKMKSSKVKNLYYAGQLTVPGPGVPPALISGQVVARELIKDHLKQ